MNHILRLQADLAAAQVALDAKDQIVRDFQTHLAGSKFQGTGCRRHPQGLDCHRGRAGLAGANSCG